MSGIVSKLISNAERCRDQIIMRSPLTGIAATLAQCLKLQEEAGELAEAVLGTLGQNPRKGFSHTHDDVMKEIIDVILTATVLAVSIETAETFSTRLDERLDFLTARAER